MSGVRLDAADSQNCRIFIGNVPINTDEDLLVEHFKKHGNVIGCIVLKGFAFVQFEKEEEAQRAIAAENGVEFLGRKMDVKVARKKTQEEKKDEPVHQHHQASHQQHEPPPSHFQRNQPPALLQDQQFGGNERQWVDNRGGRGGPRGGRGGFRGRHAPYNRRDQFGEADFSGDAWDRHGRHGPGSGYSDEYNGRGGGGFRGGNVEMMDTPEYKNDCEIVCVNKQQRMYAEMIEARLRNLGLRIDILFPNPDIPITKILDNISTRGILFAVVITPVNEQHQSLTLNVLQGLQQEHRNMPMEDAIAFIAKNFEAVVEGKLSGGISGDGMPEDIRTVVGFLVDNRPLSVMEYDKLIRFLSTRREGMLRLEYGENIPPSLANPPIGPPVEPAFKAKQDELFERIIQILNKPAPIKEPAPKSSASIAPELNASLQRAIDSLIKTGPNLLSQMNNQSGSSTTGSLHSQTGAGSGYHMSSYGRDNY